MKYFGFFLKFLLFLFSITYISCIDTILPPSKKYPGNITIPGYGRLVYTKTVFDGMDITNTLIDGDIIWSFEIFYGKIYRYNNSTKETTILDIEKRNKEGNNAIYKVNPHLLGIDEYMVINDNYLFIPFVEKIRDNCYYIVKIDRNNAAFSYNKMPDEFDITNHYGNKSLHSYFFYDNRMYFRIRDDNDGSIPYVTYDFDNYKIITEEEYSSVEENIVYNYYMDLTGRLYDAGYDFDNSTPETYLRVSIDNGNTWFTGNMGSSFPITATSKDDTIYVSCEKYHENVFLFINTLRIGGGLHIFKWDYE